MEITSRTETLDRLFDYESSLVFRNVRQRCDLLAYGATGLLAFGSTRDRMGGLMEIQTAKGAKKRREKHVGPRASKPLGVAVTDDERATIQKQAERTSDASR